MNSKGFDIKTLIMIKSYDLLKPRKEKISISFEEMFDNAKLVTRLKSKASMSEAEDFLVSVIEMGKICERTNLELYNRCKAIIETLVTINLDSQSFIDSVVEDTIKESES